MDGRPLSHRRHHHPLIPGGGGPQQMGFQQQQRPPMHLGQQHPHPMHNHSGFGFGGGGGPPRGSFGSSGPINGIAGMASHAGQKRDSTGFQRGGPPPHALDSSEGVNTKLFVGSVPRNITEDEVRRIFNEYGTVVEVALVRDKRTGTQQGFCFVKYALAEEADRAIRALHNQRILPGGMSYLQVKYANSDRDRSGGSEQKLFVGGLTKQATEEEVEAIFAPFGRVDDVYIIRDEHKQSKGCAFVRLPTKEMAISTIEALNGVHKMPGCDHPITVRYAEPKRPRSEDARVGGSGFEGPGLSPRSRQDAAGARGGGISRPGGARSPINWRSSGGPNAGPPHAQGRPFASPDTGQRPTESPPPMGGPAGNGPSMSHGLPAQGGGPAPIQGDVFPLPTLHPTRYNQIAGQLGSRVGIPQHSGNNILANTLNAQIPSHHQPQQSIPPPLTQSPERRIVPSASTAVASYR